MPMFKENSSKSDFLWQTCTKKWNFKLENWSHTFGKPWRNELKKTLLNLLTIHLTILFTIICKCFSLMNQSNFGNMTVNSVFRFNNSSTSKRLAVMCEMLTSQHQISIQIINVMMFTQKHWIADMTSTLIFFTRRSIFSWYPM